MVFRRRKKISPHNWLRQFLWPKGGWRRAGRYLFYRILRISAAPDAIAGGIAWGVAASITPLIGFHLIIAFVGARLTGHNVIAALLGTAVGNPWTFPLIWMLVYTVGSWLVPNSAPLTAIHLDALSMGAILDRFWLIFLPMMIGSLPIGLLAWIGIYYTLIRVIPVFRRPRFRSPARR